MCFHRLLDKDLMITIKIVIISDYRGRLVQAPSLLLFRVLAGVILVTTWEFSKCQVSPQHYIASLYQDISYSPSLLFPQINHPVPHVLLPALFCNLPPSNSPPFFYAPIFSRNLVYLLTVVST